MRKILLTAIFFITCFSLFSQATKSISVEKGEYWYGLTVSEGDKAPFTEGYQLNLNADVRGNQAAPLLLSSKGRYIWNDNPFDCRFVKDSIILSNYTTDFTIEKPGSTLQDAYRAASKKFFPSQGKMPDELLFSQPQYNTWIELVYNQNQADILNYAHSIIDNGFPPGVLMVDDNWAPYYGRFEFRKDRFPDAKAMMDELHSMGFKVMVWVCPFIRPDGEESRFLAEKKWVVMDAEGKNLAWDSTRKPLIASWWNGYSMVMDFSQKEAVNWYSEQLNNMVKNYGVDGFKFDAGDPEFYKEGVARNSNNPNLNEQTELWGAFGLQYPLNEYRAMWKRGGEPVAERLRDKSHSWEDMQKLIPDITTASLLGYPFACPDMIGGGEFGSFLNLKSYDQDLVVRSAQCSALMPMMQFSVAPWRILDSIHFDAVKKAVAIRKQFTPLIMRLAARAAETGEPIISNLEYNFPNQGFESCHDQFMLGDSMMIAPVVTKDNHREVMFPKGEWIDSRGTKVKGTAKKKYEVALGELLWFQKVK